jgi:hypothetical protein
MVNINFIISVNVYHVTPLGARGTHLLTISTSAYLQGLKMTVQLKHVALILILMY